MLPLQGNEWDCRATKFAKPIHGLATRRNELKKILRKSLHSQQGHYCAFCGLDMRTRGAQIEHIAPKANDRYPLFMWESKNLILACPTCNGFTKKSTFNSIQNFNAVYHNCIFSIVHPYFDDPDHHFKYIMDPNTNLAYIIAVREINGSPSQKAIQSIKLFGLSLPDMTEERYKDALALSRPLPQFEKLIEEVKTKGYISK